MTTADFAWLHDTAYAEKSRSAFADYFARLLALQEQEHVCCLLALRNGRAIGSGELLIYPHGAELANLYVVPPHRGRGVGTAMLIVLSRIARHLDQPALEIGVHPDNGRAQRLYERLGFTLDREMLLSGGEKARILRKRL